MNLFVGFRAAFTPAPRAKTILRLIGSSLYRVFLNGQFLAHGPARAAHDYFRLDELDITGKLAVGENLLALEVAGYNVNSYYLLDQPAFLQAEVVSDSQVLASTAGSGARFQALILKEKLQKVQRYTVQRTFSEVYTISPSYDLWRKDISADFRPEPCDVFQTRNLLPRRVPYPDYAIRKPTKHFAKGTVVPAEPRKLWLDRSLTQIGPYYKGFLQEELLTIPSIELQKLANVSTEVLDRQIGSPIQIHLGPGDWHILDFGTDLTGFIGTKLTCSQDTRFFITFDEILTDGDVDFTRLDCVNILTYEIKKGTYRVESFEPYTLRYAKLLVLKGNCHVEDFYLREYADSDVARADFHSSNDALNTIFSAGRETYRQNAIDLFMDCPSRERAGWLCDSYFTARTGWRLSGGTLIEKNFFENYLLRDQQAFLPEGMLPCNYPADQYNGKFHPNWAMWFVLQLEEYAARSRDLQLIAAMEPKVLRLFDYFSRFENEHSLLEKLEGSIFVEWSKANEFIDGVNFPTNMLYAAALAAAGRLFGRDELLARAQIVRQAVLEQSFDGQFFVDNALRQDGRLQPTGNRTEVCQYFAFFFDLVTSQSHPDLWKTLRDHFGPHRKQTGAFPEIHPANAFVGNYLRLELLSRQGLCRQLLAESVGYLLHMAKQTGTLWEKSDSRASCCHGFASHIVHVLYRDILGIYGVDLDQKTVHLRFSDIPLDSCCGTTPLGPHHISLRWQRDDRRLTYSVDIPPGYSLEVENLSNLQLVLQT